MLNAELKVIASRTLRVRLAFFSKLELLIENPTSRQTPTFIKPIECLVYVC